MNHVASPPLPTSKAQGSRDEVDGFRAIGSLIFEPLALESLSI